MPLIFRFLLLFMLLSQLAVAQDYAIERDIQRIDSLLEYNQFSEAEKRINELSEVLEKDYSGKKYIEQRLKLKYQKALLWDRQFEHRDALSILMEVLVEAEENDLHRLAAMVGIRIAFNQEKAKNMDVALKYLNEAYTKCKKYGFEDLYSAIFIRYALLHRFGVNGESAEKDRLAQMNFKASIDSAIYYTEKCIEYAERYRNEHEYNEGNLTMGILLKDKRLAIPYYLKTIPYWKRTNNFECVGIMYRNVADSYKRLGDFRMALKYSDSSYVYHDSATIYYKHIFPKLRSDIFMELGEMDSAYHYLKVAYKENTERFLKEESVKGQQLEEKYQLSQREAVIKNKNQQIVFVVVLLVIIVIAAALLIRNNRKINSQNKVISRQVEELVKTLEQKQVLLSELQHRVKNNLQHVISILEIQKESVDFNNIDEIIRGNQNRIHSMALLHKKLNVTDNVNEVDLNRYIRELSELVKDSYHSNKKSIQLNITCEVEKVSIEKALPIGLIVVELVSNSMKHAFKNRNVGIITIELTKDARTNNNRLYYADNGNGFDFHKTTGKGLGMEIIKGLIDQLNGEVKTSADKGFELIVFFNP